jgi:hypothetical protein
MLKLGINYIILLITDIQSQNYIEDFDSFRAALSALATNLTPGNCSDTVLSAVSSAYNNIIFDKSPVYVFTDAYAADYQIFREIIHKNADRKYPVWYLVMIG